MITSIKYPKNPAANSAH